VSGESDRREWEEFSSYWIDRCRKGEVNREGMLDRAMLELIGSAHDHRIIDICCGEGRFVRKLASEGASAVIGLDLCSPLIIESNRLRESDRELYLIADAVNLPFSHGAFDLAVSYVSLVDIAELDVAVESAYRILRQGGRFLVCNLAPMATSVNRRITEPDGSRIAIRVDNYFDETSRSMRFVEHTLTNYHRTLSTHITSFLRAGFSIRGITEPCPTSSELESFPELANELRAPSFVIYDLLKPISDNYSGKES